MLHSLLDFPENEKDRRKLMKVQELQSCAKNIGKITQVKKKLKPQMNH